MNPEERDTRLRTETGEELDEKAERTTVVYDGQGRPVMAAELPPGHKGRRVVANRQQRRAILAKKRRLLRAQRRQEGKADVEQEPGAA